MFKEKIKYRYDKLKFSLTTKRSNKFIKYDKLLSLCAFKMPSSYKSDDIYIDGLENIINTFSNIKNNKWNVRIYYDLSVFKNQKYIKLLKYALKTNICELCLYSFPDFKISKIYHSGTFGTLTRMMAFFDFENQLNYDIVYISDIDRCHYDKIKGLFDKFVNNDEVKIWYRTRPCYCGTYYNNIKSKYYEYCPMASTFITKGKYDHKIFIKYLLDIKYNSGEYKKYIEYYKSYDEKYHKNSHANILKTSLTNEIPYGCDEYFLNKYFLESVMKSGMKYMVSLRLDSYTLLKKLSYQLIDNPNKKLHLLSKILFNGIIKYNENDSKNIYKIVLGNIFSNHQKQNIVMKNLRRVSKNIDINNLGITEDNLLECLKLCIKFNDLYGNDEDYNNEQNYLKTIIIDSKTNEQELIK